MAEDPLKPLLALLGLDSLPDDVQCIQQAYKKALRANPSNASEIRAAANVLMEPESRTAYLRAMRAPLLAISSVPTVRGKAVTSGGDVASPASGFCAYGHASLQGRRPTMEDALILAAPVRGCVHAFGVCDGHGGARAAHMLARHLPTALAKRAAAASALPAAGIAAFEDVDDAICTRAQTDGWDDGSTALLAILEPADAERATSSLTLLQVGDCDAVLCAADGTLLASGLVARHRPTEVSEARRLAELGVAVSATGRVSGLAVSRAFGDVSLRAAAVPWLLATPEVHTRSLSAAEASGLLILACDGLWDFVSPAEACAVLAEALGRPAEATAVPEGRVEEAAATRAYTAKEMGAAALKLADAALDRGGDDNVSVVVVALALA